MSLGPIDSTKIGGFTQSTTKLNSLESSTSNSMTMSGNDLGISNATQLGGHTSSNTSLGSLESVSDQFMSTSGTKIGASSGKNVGGLAQGVSNAMGISGRGLGINNLTNVAGFTQAASSLDLLNNGTTKLTSVLSSAAVAGGLGKAALTLDGAASCASEALHSGLLPANATAKHVATLLNTAKSLGVTATNIKDKVANIITVAGKNNIYPPIQKNPAIEALASLGHAITCHKLKFVPYDFSDILEVNIFQAINEHPRLYIKGVLKAASAGSDGKKSEDQTVQEAVAGTCVALYSIDEQGNVEPLFQGYILKIKQTQHTDLKYIETQAVNCSYSLDVTKHSCSFQRTSATYGDIIAAVIPQEAQVAMIVEDKAVEKLIVQYKESEWEFLQRLSSHYNTGLVVNPIAEKPQIYFGVATGDEAKDITVASYAVQKNIGKYRTTEANHLTHSNVSISDIDFTSYQVESFDRHNIGDAINFLNHTLYVKSIETTLEQGMLKYSYILVTKVGLLQPDLFNENLIGVSLMGQVKLITNDQIKAHIVEIDQAWDEEADWYFPYSTVFSTPKGGGWYAMPEPGDTVRINFPTHKDEDATAASSVNRDQSAKSEEQTESGGGDGGGAEPPRSDPDKKSMSNIYGKEVLFTPDGIYITNQAGKIFINLTNADGITIVSELDINIQSKENIVIKADKELFLIAGENLKLTNGASTISMDKANIIEIQGSEVKTN